MFPAPPDTLWLTGPSVTLAVTMTLALSYNRSRVFFICCTLAFCLWLNGQEVPDRFADFVFGIVIPLNILLICYYRERGTLTAMGLMRFLIIACQITLAIYAIRAQWIPAESTINPFGTSVQDIQAIVAFGQMPALILLCSFIGCLIFVGLDDTPISQGITTAFAGLSLGFLVTVPHAWEVYLMASSLYLGASIIRDSHNMAYRDELTRLPHRRALNEQMMTLGSRYSLAMLDVDHFKKFNDTHGHDVGDQVLQMVAAKISQVSGGGKAYRYGGEEFAIVFSRMNKTDAFYYLDEVRKSIANYEMVMRRNPREDTNEEKQQRKQRQRGSFRTASDKVSVTISIGVSDRRGGENAEDVLKAADEALYAAKKAGRNQVCMSA